MLQELIRRTIEFIHDKDEDVDNRIGVMYTATGVVASAVGLIICLLSRVSLLGVFTVLFVFLFTSAVVYMAFRKKLWLRLAGDIVIYEVLIAIPIIWISSGGLASGCTIWMIYQLVYIAVSRSGRARNIMLLTGVLLDTGCLLLQILAPQYVFTFSELWQFQISMIGSLIVVTIALIFTFEEYKKIYRENQDDLKLRNEALANAVQHNRGFLATMSHEVRTPMNAVLGMNELILRHPEDIARVRDYSIRIKKAGRNLISIINDILDVSKIEEGCIEIVEAPYDLPEMMSDIYSMLRDRAQDKKLALIFSVMPDVPKQLLGDRNRIQQVLVNIISNAIKYTHDGFVMVTVEYQKDGDTGICIFTVKDSGIGIPEETLPYIFNSYKRSLGQQVHEIEGTGLGLFIVDQFTEAMHGTVSVTSHVGEGSEFIVRLPQAVNDEELVGSYEAEKYMENQISNEPEPEKEMPMDLSSISGSRVLVVDDAEMNRELLVQVLEDMRLKPSIAENGLQALEMLREQPFDLVLMDICMPVMDGIEAIGKLREEAAETGRSWVPVIAFTADNVKHSMDEYLRMGFDAAETKPIEMTHLQMVILELLAKKQT